MRSETFITEIIRPSKAYIKTLEHINHWVELSTLGKLIYAKSTTFLYSQNKCFIDESVIGKHIVKSSVLINLPFCIFFRKCLEFKHYHNRNHILKDTHSFKWEWVFLLSIKEDFLVSLKNNNNKHFTHFYILLWLIFVCWQNLHIVLWQKLLYLISAADID